MESEKPAQPWRGRRSDGRRLRETSAELTTRAQELRRTPTMAEQVLWEALQGKQLDGARFRFQHPVQTFILDFYCPKYKLVIEVDGDIHTVSDIATRDRERQQLLELRGFHLLRLTNDEVINHLPDALERIRLTITELSNISTEE